MRAACSPLRPNTVLIANGLAVMGFAVPAAMLGEAVHSRRNVSPDGAAASLITSRCSRTVSG